MGEPLYRANQAPFTTSCPTRVNVFEGRSPDAPRRLRCARDSCPRVEIVLPEPEAEEEREIPGLVVGVGFRG